MIITEINGGLGNQLFQYAAGLALSKKHNTPLKINTNFNSLDTNRRLALTHFNIDVNQANQIEINHLYPSSSLNRKIQSILPTSRKSFYKEQKISFQSNFSQLSSSVYLKGYWQSEMYFSSINQLIKEKYILDPACYKNASDFIQQLSSHESVSIHVRKGDYLKAPYNAYYAELNNEYYKRAIGFLKEICPALKVYVFTDDPSWVEQHLDLGLPFELASGHKTNSMFEDFQAMRSCKYHVIANSSFSWWTAWLSAHPDKIVVAPSNWFKNSQQVTVDLIPKSWNIL